MNKSPIELHISAKEAYKKWHKEHKTLVEKAEESEYIEELPDESQLQRSTGYADQN